MRLFKLLAFQRFAEKEAISDAALKGLAAELEENPTKGGLGGMVHKLRLARQGEGKSGGYRVLLFFRQGDTLFFAHGFAKSDMANISNREREALKEQAKLYMRCDQAQIARLLHENRLIELL